jgi:hypothetical protein
MTFTEIREFERTQLTLLLSLLKRQNAYFTEFISVAEHHQSLLQINDGARKLHLHQLLATCIIEKQQLLASLKELQSQIDLIKELWLSHQNSIDDLVIEIRLLIKEIEGKLHHILCISSGDEKHLHSPKSTQSNIEI